MNVRHAVLPSQAPSILPSEAQMLMGIGCENGYPSNTNLGTNRPSSFKPLSSRPGSAGPAGTNTHSALMGTHAGEERMFIKYQPLTSAISFPGITRFNTRN